MAKFVKEVVPRERVTRAYLMRHGAVGPEWNERVYGQWDVSLSPEGEAQADRLAERLASARLDAVYTSDLVRALETARRVARPHELFPRTVPELREASFGHWQGVLWSDILARHMDEVDARITDLAAAKMKEGESFLELRERVIPAFRALVERHRGGRIGLVSHGGVTRVIIADALGLDLGSIARIEQSPACLNIIDFSADDAILRLLNG